MTYLSSVLERAQQAEPMGAPALLPGRVRLRTLINLRWLAVIGQLSAVLFVAMVLDFKLPLGAALAVISVSAWLNLVMMLALPAQRLVTEWEAGAQLGFDVLQLAVLLGLTGGVENPFLLLFIAPVAASATALRPGPTMALAGLAILCVALLYFWRAPLPWRAGETFAAPDLYRLGLAAAVVVGVGFTSVYAWRVAVEEERLTLALAAVQDALAKEQRLAALGGLAAAAAHELGTPLGTIQLTCKEMRSALPKDSPLAEDVELLISQSERCRNILMQLSKRPEKRDALHERSPVAALLEDAAQAHRGLGADIVVDAAPEDGEGPLEIRRLPEILHGLGNLIENAVGFAANQVEVKARWSSEVVVVEVKDDGPGFPPHILTRLGEPYISERSGGDAAGGLGLGFFIAKTLLERSGAKVEAKNRAAPETGASVVAVWPRSLLAAPRLFERM